MNKPELIKRIAKEMTYYLMLPSMPRESNKDMAREQSNRPNFYEGRIPSAETFVEQLIEDKIINE